MYAAPGSSFTNRSKTAKPISNNNRLLDIDDSLLEQFDLDHINDLNVQHVAKPIRTTRSRSVKKPDSIKEDKTRKKLEDECQIRQWLLSSGSSTSSHKQVRASNLKADFKENQKCNTATNQCKTDSISKKELPMQSIKSQNSEEVDFFKLICIDESHSQVNLENFSCNTSTCSQSVNTTQASQQQAQQKQKTQESSSNSTNESRVSRWQFKCLPNALKESHKSNFQGQILSKSTPKKFSGNGSLNFEDYCENEVFNMMCAGENIDSKLNKIKTEVQSPILFTSSSDSAETVSKLINSQCGSSSSSNSKLHKQTLSQVTQKSSQTQFSQLFKSSQVVRQIDEAIEKEKATKDRLSLVNVSQNINSEEVLLANSEEKHTNFKLPLGSCNFKSQKRKSSEYPRDVTKIQKIENKENFIGKSENLNDSSVGYRKEMSQMFEKVQQSICQLGANQPEASGVEWIDDSFMTEAVLSGFSQQSKSSSINDVIKKALEANANKGIEPQNLVNHTLISSPAVFRSMGPFYGLPNKVMELIKLYKGIEALYDWQDECLRLPAVERRKNLLYCLPTSGGKTLVAEILILREMLCRKRNVIFVLPYVAIVQEKVWALSPFAVALGFLIEEYAAGKGIYPPKKRRYKNSVFIATTEKALGLVNSLVEQGRLEELGLVVVDELHLIGDDQRGSILETLLTKLMYLNEDVQIVGMSATIGNLEDIQKFLKADVYSRNFRPVELIEYLKCENQMARIDLNAKDGQILIVEKQFPSNLKNSKSANDQDPDRLGTLVGEVIPQESCLIFCASKKNCENVSRLLCKTVTSQLLQHKVAEKQQLINALKTDSEGFCATLAASVPYGIAYHHSGLTADERRLIEEAFRSGILCVICCTSTLAAGVNLPAKRVIIRRPYIAKDFINLSRYKQMVGRAGRTGFSEVGESILICEKKDLPKVVELLTKPMDHTLSKMHENENACLRLLFLSSISLGTANTKAHLEKVANMTLLAVQQEKLNVNMKQLTRKVIADLFVLRAIEIFEDSKKNTKNNSGPTSDISVYINSSSDSMLSMENINDLPKSSGSGKKTKRRIVLQGNDKLVVSKLGSAAIKGCLDLAKAHILYEDLQKAQESLVLIDCLHLLYLVTPYNLVEQNRIDRSHYHSIMMNLGNNERKTASVLGITDSCIMRLYSNKNIKGISERVLHRFYISLMLYDLWNEASIAHVSEKYQMDRGTVQNLMTNSAGFASKVVSFCEQLEEFWAFVHLLKGMSQRLAHCCCKELLPLMELPAVKQSRARQLYEAGFKNLQSIAKADPNDIIHAVEFMSRRLANQLIAAAKMLLLEKVETLREEAEAVLEGMEHPQLVFNRSFL